ncbi:MULTISPECIES: helix-turn-helix domain-containing protein [unclassified Methylobacterium]|uniref:helix-turn-helix domain-containing protein n=1 Tax=unclassified Methylobacterium TaxID=2615210 RepID=UPI000CC11AF8|nr:MULTISPECIES: helix-turn-helix domain-containing protein [unclassified Methylobacterium]PIU05067.1 MAG: hypothetical protein COT56_16465 [Methylobacterium sp. CG09_land_8_20_14_0_10_71_15]PIU11857.1 MAG: hypothetical protein COT28_17820 [Methylobacterium sp. CG08_land_8_20_14_0_20_71_15]GBU19024.1 hypothetical protein AwMethylo_32390 [Methylobacterium sp.]
MAPAELRRRFEAGESYASIARECGVGENAVRYRARKLGVRELVNAAAVPAPSAPALRLALSHVDISLKRIAAAFGCHPSTVSRVAKEYGLPTDAAGRAALMGAR